MTVLQMRCFLEVCKTKKYSEAADKMGMMQSTLFKQLKAMEDELFIKIFDKGKRGIKLTGTGEVLYPYIVFMYGEYEKMIEKLQEYYTSENAVLQLGSLYFTKQYDILQMIKEFGAIQPNIKISMDEYRSNELEEMLRTGKLNAGFTYKELVDFEYKKILSIRDDYLVAVMNKNHHLALHDSIMLSELKAEQFVLMKGDERLYKQLLNFCIEEGFVPKEYNMDIRLETMKELISTSGCVTILMRTMAEDLIEDDNLVMVMIEGSKKLTLSFVVQNDTRACEAFANYIS